MSKRTTTTVDHALEGQATWDFGDYPYALEPLRLPQPGQPLGIDSIEYPEVRDEHGRVHAAWHDGHRTEFAESDQQLERLFWFRWIIGHHMSFVLWRLLADQLRLLETGNGDQHRLARDMIGCVRGYSAMLLYTGSSTPAMYNASIRPSMYRLHNTFSGTWSADFPAVRSLFRGRRLPPVVAEESENLRREIQLSHRIHLGVASKLVSGGRSLLQGLVDSRAPRQHHAWSDIFDCYFLTVREPVSGGNVATQFLRRCRAVTTDLATNGLYPRSAHYPADVPEDLASPEVGVYQSRLAETVVDLADQVAGANPAEDVAAPEPGVRRTP